MVQRLIDVVNVVLKLLMFIVFEIIDRPVEFFKWLNKTKKNKNHLKSPNPASQSLFKQVEQNLNTFLVF